MSTSEERREVAARLRVAAKTESGSTDYLWNRLEIAVNGWKFGDVIDESYVHYNGVLARIADLIDPTCHNADDGVRGGFVCSECGYHVEQDTMDADFNAWEDLRHCPHCGARVTSGGEG